MKLGANDVSAVKIGATDVNKVYLGSNLVWEKASPLLLDDYPNAAAAYSLRKLRNAYTGSAIEVRRSSDNTEQDIGFVDNELDTASLLSFVGSGDGFVTTWYDQSGAGNNVTQSSGSAQPQIVSSGSLITQNGKPNLQFDGSNDYFEASSVTTGNPKSIFIPNKFDSIGSTEKVIFDSITTNQSLLYKSSSNRIGIGFGSFILTSYTATTDFTLYSIFHNGSTSNVYIDSSTQIVNNQNLGTNAFNGLRIGAVRGSASLFFNGFIPEFIMWGSEQSSNKAGIETNINSYYNMYWDGSQTGLLDDYPNAEAAYSLRALNSAYTSSAIRVRRSSDNAERDINLLYDGSLDTSSLLSFVGAGDGFVTTWYDQSGEGNDAAQGSASKQPKIVSSGAVITENGEPSVEFNGTTDYIQNQLSVGPTVTAFAVSKIVDEFDFNFIYDSFGDGGRVRLGLFNTKKYFADNADGGGILAFATTASNGLQNLFFTKHTNSDVSISVNQDTLQTVESTNFSQNSQNWVIGARNDGADHFLEGTIQELIIYPSNQSSDRSGIETNINNYYDVY